MPLTPVQRRVLKACSDEGGTLELTGFDRSPSVNQKTWSVVENLQAKGLVTLESVRDKPVGHWCAKITEAGKAVVATFRK